MADVNGDGKADIVGSTIGQSNGWYTHVDLSTGNGAFGTLQLTAHSSTGYATGWGWQLADVNGDGKADIVGSTIGQSNGWYTHSPQSQGSLLLMINCSNGLGGATTISYEPSTQYVNTQLSYPVQTVSAVTTCDNWAGTTCAGLSSTTTYSYTGGYHQIGEREFRGFKTAVVTSPGVTDADKTLTTMWFHQGNELSPVDTEDPGLPNGYMKGKPYRVEVHRKSDDYLFSKTETTYLADQIGLDTAAPWFTPVKQVDAAIE